MKKIVNLFLAICLTLLAFNPLANHVQASEKDIFKENYQVYESDKKEIERLRIDLEQSNISEEDILLGLRAEFQEEGLIPQKLSIKKNLIAEPYGIKSKAAAIAAKQMIKKIKDYGKSAWNSTVKEYISKLPLTSGAKKTLERYLGYQIVMDSLNVVINFQGDIVSALTEQMEDIGIPSWLAGMASRALVFLLL